MSLPSTSPFPPCDEVRIRALLRSWASGIIVPLEFAERVYKIGNEACHRTMASLAQSSSEESFDLSVLERVTIARALVEYNGDKLRTAQALGIGKTTLYRKIAAYGIEPDPRIVCPSCGRVIRRALQDEGVDAASRLRSAPPGQLSAVEKPREPRQTSAPE